MARHGTISAVLDHASLTDCRSAGGEDDLSIRLRQLSALCLAVNDANIARAAKLPSTATLARLLRREMAGLSVETFRVLFLAADNRLIDDRVMWTGSVGSVQTYPREVVRAAVELSAVAVILVHNHPCGDARPSDDDVTSTEAIVAACALLDIVVRDHVILASGGFFSMHAAGLLPARLPIPIAQGACGHG